MLDFENFLTRENDISESLLGAVPHRLGCFGNIMSPIDDDPHDEIARLEDEIEDLTARIKNCRKFILAAQVAMAAAAAILAAMLFGIMRLDLTWMAGAMAAIIGGIVVFGSNNSTAKEAQAEIGAAESRRAMLIGQLDLHDVAERPTLH